MISYRSVVHSKPLKPIGRQRHFYENIDTSGGNSVYRDTTYDGKWINTKHRLASVLMRLYLNFENSKLTIICNKESTGKFDIFVVHESDVLRCSEHTAVV